VCVPAYNEAYVQVNMPQLFNNQEVLLERPPCVLSVSVLRALAFCKNNKAICHVLNTNLYVVTVKKGLKLAKIAGLIDTVASMREICQPPLTSSGEHKQAPVFKYVRHILSAFYQIGLHEESRELTSFTGPDGHCWRYSRSPMGMSNSPSQLNLLLSNIFSDKSRLHSLACYVDTILIYSNDWNAHVQQLELARKPYFVQPYENRNRLCRGQIAQAPS